ncbi:MAG: hypothetical protein HY690_09865 [Chloroflexi bacterium]|nr:hypothetical protein [Chloroflexota bacterium]
MKSLTDYSNDSNVLSALGPIVPMLESEALHEAEGFIAGLTAWVLRQLEEHRMGAGRAGWLFTLLDVYLTDNYPHLELSPEAQELLFEGAQLHHYGDELAPDPAYLRELIEEIFHHPLRIPA